MEIRRLLTNVCSDDLVQSKHFYVSLFDFKIGFDSDWFVHLLSTDRELELGIISRNHDIVPLSAQTPSGGVYLTFVVDDVTALHEKAKALDCEIFQAPALTPYGQLRMIVLAPEGTVCDMSSPSDG